MANEKQAKPQGQPAAQEPADRHKTRRPYTSPSVTEYGSIARLTHAGGSTAKETGVPLMKSGCL